MSDHTTIFPRQRVPDLSVPTVGGGTWTLGDQSPENFTMIVFYRGYHCPRCKLQLIDLDHKVARFEERGCGVIAVSMDTQERAEKAKQNWGIGGLTIGYGLAEEKARQWGLYISTSRGKTSTGHEEPPQFSEPGLFLVRPDGTLYFASVQTMPFSRPRFADILGALDFVIANDYPGRGEVVDHHVA